MEEAVYIEDMWNQEKNDASYTELVIHKATEY